MSIVAQPCPQGDLTLTITFAELDGGVAARLNVMPDRAVLCLDHRAGEVLLVRAAEDALRHLLTDTTRYCPASGERPSVRARHLRVVGR